MAALGEFLPLLTVSKFQWKDVARTYIEESFDRNVKWLLAKYPGNFQKLFALYYTSSFHFPVLLVSRWGNVVILQNWNLWKTTQRCTPLVCPNHFQVFQFLSLMPVTISYFDLHRKCGVHSVVVVSRVFPPTSNTK